MQLIDLITSNFSQRRKFADDLLNNHVPFRSQAGNFLDINYSVGPNVSRFTWQTDDVIAYDQSIRGNFIFGTQSNFLRDVTAVFYGDVDLEIYNDTAAPVGPVTPQFTWREPSVDVAGTGVAFGADVYLGALTVPANSRVQLPQKTFRILSQSITFNGLGLTMQGYFRGVLILGKFSG